MGETATVNSLGVNLNPVRSRAESCSSRSISAWSAQYIRVRPTCCACTHPRRRQPLSVDRSTPRRLANTLGRQWFACTTRHLGILPKRRSLRHNTPTNVFVNFSPLAGQYPSLLSWSAMSDSLYPSSRSSCIRLVISSAASSLSKRLTARRISWWLSNPPPQWIATDTRSVPSRTSTTI